MPGLKRINISLDTLDPARFERLTRRPGLERVIEGIMAAKEAGFDPVKINAVAIRGETEEDVVPAGAVRPRAGLELRFIEYMPLDAGHLWEREKVLFAADIIDLIADGDRAARAGEPILTPGRLRSTTNTPTAGARSGSSRRSAGRSA